MPAAAPAAHEGEPLLVSWERCVLQARGSALVEIPLRGEESMTREFKSMDGNNAAAYVSYAFTEVAGIYPITP